MKKMMMSAMMVMAMMSFTVQATAQDNGQKAKKECCEKKDEAKPCCKEQAKGKVKDCSKCTECKPECGEKGCKECPNNHKCKKNCKK